MYINLQLFLKSGLKANELIYLIAARQIEKNVLETMSEAVFSRLQELSLIECIKGSKNENPLHKVRLSNKGKDLLTRLSYEGAVDEESERLGEWLISVYKNKSGGFVKNKTELKRRLQWFKQITAIKGNFLALLLQSAINDTYASDCGKSFDEYKRDDNPRAILSNMGENLLWTADSIYDKHKTLDKSPLYIYYQDNQEYIENLWATYLDEDGNKKK